MSVSAETAGGAGGEGGSRENQGGRGVGGEPNKLSDEEHGILKSMCVKFSNVEPSSVKLVLACAGYNTAKAVVTLSSMSSAATARFLMYVHALCVC